MNNIDKRIEELELKKEQIENEIQKLVSIKELEQFKKSIKEVKTNSDNIDLFDYYLCEIKGLKPGTRDNYCKSLDDMRSLIYERLNIDIPVSFYNIDDDIIFNKIIELFNSDDDLVELNKKWHHTISAAYNNYYKFLLYKKEL